MKEQIWGFVTGNWHLDQPFEPIVDSYIQNIVDENADGIYLTTRVFGEDVQLLMRRLAEVKKNLIIGYQINWPMREPDMTLLGESLKWSRRIALGNVIDGEFCSLVFIRRGTMDPRRSSITMADRCQSYLRIAQRYGFEWVSCLTHRCLLVDMLGGEHAREVLLNSQTLTIPLCAYIIAGYLHGDPRVPDQGHYIGTGMLRPITSLTNRNLHQQYGVTGDKLRAYCGPMNILSGGGGQGGLDAGTRLYMRQLGFNGLVIGLPFTLKGSEDVTIYPELEHYPPSCGNFKRGYRST